MSSDSEDYPTCDRESNAVLACYPEDDTDLIQDEWSRFVWNARYPIFIGAGSVDIYAHQAGSEEVVQSWTDIPNARGHIPVSPQEDWFPTRTSWSSGETSTGSFYFVVVTAGAETDGSEPHQATFHAFQTSPPSSLAESLSSEAAARSSEASQSSVASAASATELEITRSDGSEATITPTPFESTLSDGEVTTITPTPSTSTMSNGEETTIFSPLPSNLQNNSDSGDDVPVWAIVVPIVLGLLFLLTLTSCLYIVFTRRRRRQKEQQVHHQQCDEPFSEPSSPTRDMTENPHDTPAKDPLLGVGAAAAAAAAAAPGSAADQTSSTRRQSQQESERTTSPQHDSHAAGPATVSKSSRGSHDDSGLTGEDAVNMAAAFRNALRKPSFQQDDGGDSSGETTRAEPTPLSETGEQPIASTSASARRESVIDTQMMEGKKLIDKELANEGTSVRSLDGRKKPSVHDGLS